MIYTPYQPTLPAEIDFTEAELNFMEESPPGLFPENQNSNFGYAIRKIFSDNMQEAIDQVETLYTERFVITSTMFLPEWEQDYGLPVAPTGKTTAERRSMIQSRIHIGPFTRARVKAIVEQYLNAAIGVPISLTPDGVPIVAGGIPLFGDYIPGTALYRVYEDIRGFAYEVKIVNTVTPDVTGITRELLRITPSGITFTVNNSSSQVLDYFRTVRNKQPVGYYRLDSSGQDASGYANHGTAFGSPTYIVTPGLMTAGLAGVDGAYDFDGIDDYVSIPHAAQLNMGNFFSLEMWVRRDAVSGTLFHRGAANFQLYTDSSAVYFQHPTGNIAISTIPLTIGTTYHIVATKNGDDSRIFINGVDRTGVVTNYTFPDTATTSRIGSNTGGTQFFSGVIDEVALYNRVLTPTEILENYNTGKNIA